MAHGVSIVSRNWSGVRAETWLDLGRWRALVASNEDLELTERLPNIDPAVGKVVEELRPNTARWTGHPSGVVFIFLWRIGRLEVGAMYPEENGGTTFALADFDFLLQERCVSIAKALDAEVDRALWEDG